MKNRIISTEQLVRLLDDSEATIIDIRSSSAYNGWKVEGESRGGHIKGAVNLPNRWFESFSSSELEPQFLKKKISLKGKFILYGYRDHDFTKISNILAHMGIEEYLIYRSGINDWASHTHLPMQSLKKYKQLVFPEWLKHKIKVFSPDMNSDNKNLLFEIGNKKRGELDYLNGHIPSAVYFDLSRIETGPVWNLCDDNVLQDVFVSLGISASDDVVLYGREMKATTRAALVLMYGGVSNVRILDGGKSAWTNAGFPLEKNMNNPKPVSEFGMNFPGRRDYVIGLEEIKRNLNKKNVMVVSLRSWSEYTGESSGYEYIQEKGHIPGAIWGESDLDSHDMDTYHEFDGSMRNYHEIESMWKLKGIIPGNRIIFYCGTGWRASEAFFYAYLMGWEDISVYDGGWVEWCQNLENPKETGLP